MKSNGSQSITEDRRTYCKLFYLYISSIVYAIFFVHTTEVTVIRMNVTISSNNFPFCSLSYFPPQFISPVHSHAVSYLSGSICPNGGKKKESCQFTQSQSALRSSSFKWPSACTHTQLEEKLIPRWFSVSPFLACMGKVERERERGRNPSRPTFLEEKSSRLPVSSFSLRPNG